MTDLERPNLFLPSRTHISMASIAISEALSIEDVKDYPPIDREIEGMQLFAKFAEIKCRPEIQTVQLTAEQSDCLRYCINRWFESGRADVVRSRSYQECYRLARAMMADYGELTFDS